MKRAQRRQQKRQDAKHNQRDPMKETIVYMEVLIAHALHIDYGFSTKRINRVLERVKKLSTSITEKRMTAAEMLQWCETMKIKL